MTECHNFEKKTFMCPRKNRPIITSSAGTLSLTLATSQWLWQCVEGSVRDLADAIKDGQEFYRPIANNEEAKLPTPSITQIQGLPAINSRCSEQEQQ